MAQVEYITHPENLIRDNIYRVAYWKRGVFHDGEEILFERIKLHRSQLLICGWRDDTKRFAIPWLCITEIMYESE